MSWLITMQIITHFHELTEESCLACRMLVRYRQMSQMVIKHTQCMPSTWWAVRNCFWLGHWAPKRWQIVNVFIPKL